MRSIDDCINWIQLIKKFNPNTEDLNFLNSIDVYLRAYNLVSDQTIDTDKWCEAYKAIKTEM